MQNPLMNSSLVRLRELLEIYEYGNMVELPPYEVTFAMIASFVIAFNIPFTINIDGVYQKVSRPDGLLEFANYLNAYEREQTPARVQFNLVGNVAVFQFISPRMVEVMRGGEE